MLLFIMKAYHEEQSAILNLLWISKIPDKGYIYTTSCCCPSSPLSPLSPVVLHVTSLPLPCSCSYTTAFVRTKLFIPLFIVRNRLWGQEIQWRASLSPHPPIHPHTPTHTRLMNNLSLFRCLVHPRVSHLFNSSPTPLVGNSTPFSDLPTLDPTPPPPSFQSANMKLFKSSVNQFQIRIKLNSFEGVYITGLNTPQSLSLLSAACSAQGFIAGCLSSQLSNYGTLMPPIQLVLRSHMRPTNHSNPSSFSWVVLLLFRIFMLVLFCLKVNFPTIATLPFSATFSNACECLNMLTYLTNTPPPTPRNKNKLTIFVKHKIAWLVFGYLECN